MAKVTMPRELLIGAAQKNILRHVVRETQFYQYGIVRALTQGNPRKSTHSYNKKTGLELAFRALVRRGFFVLSQDQADPPGDKPRHPRTYYQLSEKATKAMEFIGGVRGNRIV
jgi:hypothetical protein